MQPSFDDRDGVIWFDGELVPWREARVHVLSHALHYGGSVFEGERAYNGKIFRLEAHNDRFFKSAEHVGFSIPYEKSVLAKARYTVLKENGIMDGYVRPVAWRGSEEMGLGARNTKIHTAIAAWEWPPYFGAKALRFTIADWRRPPPMSAPSHAKASGLYMICTLAKHKAVEEGYDDALMLDWRGRIAECTAANIFFVIDGELHTPVPDCFLDGITRQTVIELAKKRDIRVVERVILPEEMARADECFVTGTAAEVKAVAQIGEYTFTPGEVTETIQNDYARAVGKKPGE